MTKTRVRVGLLAAMATLLLLAAPSPARPLSSESSDGADSSGVRETGFVATAGHPVDAAFQGRHLFISTKVSDEEGRAGMVDGFEVYEISQKAPFLRRVAIYRCTGTFEGAISVIGRYLIQSVEPGPLGEHGPAAGKVTKVCNNTDDSHGKSGLRIVDVSDVSRPRQVKFVEVGCGSHTHAMIPRRGAIYIYGGRSHEACSDTVPMVPNFQMQVVRFYPSDVRKTERVGAPLIDPQLNCHDVSYFAPRAAAVCAGASPTWSLLDASDPPNPEVHSTEPEPNPGDSSFATTTWDGRVLVTGYGAPVIPCNATADVTEVLRFYDIEDLARPGQVGQYAPSWREPGEASCGPRRVQILPLKDSSRYVALTAWRADDIAIVDFSEPSAPAEVGRWMKDGVVTDAAYWYNGRIYALQNGTDGYGVRILEFRGLGKELHHYKTGLNPRTQVRDFR